MFNFFKSVTLKLAWEKHAHKKTNIEIQLYKRQESIKNVLNWWKK